MNEDIMYGVDFTTPRQESLPALEPSRYRLRDPVRIDYIKDKISAVWKTQYGVNPSPNPVSLSRSDIPSIKQGTKYVVAEKADGVQYLLLLGMWEEGPFAVMIDRKFQIYEVQLIAHADYYERGTLLIGELVWEHEPAMIRQLYLVYDSILIKGDNVSQSPYLQRYAKYMACMPPSEELVNMITTPREWRDKATTLAESGFLVFEVNKYATAIKGKRCVSVDNLVSLWRTMDTYKHQTDGLIFTPDESPVGSGTQHNLFKWKPVHTIDLEAQGTRNINKWTWELFYRTKGVLTSCKTSGVYVPVRTIKKKRKRSEATEPEFEEMHLHLKNTMYLAQVEQHYNQYEEHKIDIIMECTCDTKGGLELVRVRPDKTQANDRNTIDMTIRNIFENIQITDLA